MENGDLQCRHLFFPAMIVSNLVSPISFCMVLCSPAFGIITSRLLVMNANFEHPSYVWVGYFSERKHEGPLGHVQSINPVWLYDFWSSGCLYDNSVSQTHQQNSTDQSIQKPHTIYQTPTKSSLHFRSSYTETSSSGRFFGHSLLGEFLSHAGLNLPCLLHVLLWHLSIINVALKALAAGKNAMPHTPGKDANLVEKTLKKKRKKKGWLGCFQHLCFFFAISVFWAGGGGDLVSKKKRRKAFQTWSKLLQKEGS